MFFDDWFGPLRVAVVGPLAHAALVAPLRASGKRTLSKLNAFDLVVTVALGSTLATALLSKDVALAGPQWAVAKLSLRSPRSSRLVKAEPRLPPHRGRFLDGALRDERVTRDEVLATLRAAGVAAVAPETDDSFNVVRDAPPEAGTPTLKGVVGREG